MNVAFIPIRGGSKSIPLKNIKPICGMPLVYWVVKSACCCAYIDEVYVATDSEDIKEVVEGFKNQACFKEINKLVVIGRSKESATDNASTESAMLEFADRYDFDNIVLIQATSPLLQAKDLNHGFETFLTEGTDSVLSVVRQKRFNWAIDKDGNAYSENYNVYDRPRRQDFPGCLVENGAFYITTKKGLISSKNRVSGRIKVVEMDEDSYYEIDEPSDWAIVECLLRRRLRKEKQTIPEIKMLLSDCDGCLTDGGMYYSENGDELKKFNTKDGMGFALIKKRGIVTGIITGEKVSLNKRRAEKMKIDEYVPGCSNKLEAVFELCKKYSICIDNVCYIGDDVNDVAILDRVGYGCCPADAVNEVKEIADYVANSNGGEGVIREVIDRVLEFYEK